MNVILVTGVAGFVGSNLAKRLLQDKKNYVIGIDNFYSSTDENLLEFKDHDRFNFMERDVNTLSLSEIIKVDQIYHLACPASPKFYQYDPVFTLDTCYQGTKNMLELATRDNAIFLLTSTSEIYGEPLEHPQKETYRGNVSCLGPRSCYDEGKRVAEALTFSYRRHNKIRACVARIFNTYGPGMMADDGRVISNFITQALEGRPITLYGDGSQTRSFCYVSDTVEGLVSLMNSDEVGPVNIGNPAETTIKELAGRIIVLTIGDRDFGSLTDDPVEMVCEELPVDDPSRRKPDITRAKETLGWSPKVSLEDGLLQTVRWFREKDKE